MVPFGKAVTRREGTDVVVITWGAMVQRSLVAAQQAEKEGVSVMVVDLRTIMPFDWNGIAAAVRNDQPRRHRARGSADVRIRRGNRRARRRRTLRSASTRPIRRVAALDTPVAYHPDLEDAILPGSARVLETILETARY